MIRSIIGGAAAAALLAAPALSASRDRGAPSPTWIITPADAGCRTDLTLRARSGAVTPVTLTSDGELVSLRFRRSDLPARAFLPIRVDGKAFANLMLRGDDGAGELVLSADTEAALRRGGTLGVAWLGPEPLQAPLAGAERGLRDLRTCGVQTAARHREQAAADLAARDRAAADARARALADAQLAAVRAQAAAAEAQRRNIEEAAERQRRADAEQAERQRQAALDAEAEARAERQRAWDQARARSPWPASDDDEEDAPRWAPPQPRWPAPRAYYPPHAEPYPWP